MQFENVFYDHTSALLIFGIMACLMVLVGIVAGIVVHKIPRLNGFFERIFVISLPTLMIAVLAIVIPMSIHQKGEIKEAYISNIEKKYDVENVEFIGYGETTKGNDEKEFNLVKLTVDGEEHGMIVDSNEETFEPTLDNIPFTEKEDHLDVESLLRK